MAISLLSLPSGLLYGEFSSYLNSQAILSLRGTSKVYKQIAEKMLEKRWPSVSALFTDILPSIQGSDYLDSFKKLAIYLIDTYGLEMPPTLPITADEYLEMIQEAHKAEDTAFLAFTQLYFSTLGRQTFKDVQEARERLEDSSSPLRRKTYKVSALLNDNTVRLIPEGINKIQCITKLEITSLLRTLSIELFQLTRLNSLTLYDTKLSHIPPQIGQLTKLKELHFKRSRLTSLPSEIGKLPLLEKFSVSHARLQSLPVEISHLKWLKELDFSYNVLITIPDSLVKLRKLTHLQFQQNPILFVEEKIRHSKTFTEKFNLKSLIEDLKQQSDYNPTSPLGELYHAVLEKKTDEELKTLLTALSPEDKALILETDKKAEQLPTTRDEFYRAVFMAIHTKYKRLSKEQKKEVSSHLEALATLYEAPASLYNFPLLADAMDLLDTSEEDPQPQAKRQKTE